MYRTYYTKHGYEVWYIRDYPPYSVRVFVCYYAC